MSNLKNNDAKIATISTSHFFTPFLCEDQCKFYYFKILDTSCKVYIKQVAFQSNANHPLAEYMKFEGMLIFYFDLDVTLTLMCDLDLINDLPHTKGICSIYTHGEVVSEINRINQK